MATRSGFGEAIKEKVISAALSFIRILPDATLFTIGMYFTLFRTENGNYIKKFNKS